MLLDFLEGAIGGVIDAAIPTPSEERDHYGNTLNDYTEARDSGHQNPTSSSSSWW